MDAMLSSFILFFVCVTLGLQKASAQIDEVTLHTDDPTKQCITKYTSCSLKLDDKLFQQRGDKGEDGKPGADGTPGEVGAKGEPGLTGLQGGPGIQGEKGDPGSVGLPGAAGAKGDRGEKGETGLQGPPGVKGEIGPPADKGVPGLDGIKGDRGEDGEKGPAGPEGKAGPVGPPGAPGTHGVCPCRNIANIPAAFESSGKDVGYKFGSEDSPEESPCKSAPSDVKSGTYYMGPEGKPITVYCNMDTLETCIWRNKITPELNYDASNGAFWLHQKDVHISNLYTDISVEQLIWLRDRAEYVRQTLKYNCLDSVPYSKYNMSSSVKLWAWNDAIIGPYPTEQSPIFYSVPEATDNCVEGSTAQKSTIIELKSSNVYRLPIVDMWIGDVRHAGQKMSIESVELCFG